MLSAQNIESLRARPDAARIPVLAPCLQHETGDGELVVYVVHSQELLMFNGVGAGVYLLLDGQRSIADVLEILLDALPADPEQALRDVQQFLGDLAARGVLSLRDPEDRAPVALTR